MGEANKAYWRCYQITNELLDFLLWLYVENHSEKGSQEYGM